MKFGYDWTEPTQSSLQLGNWSKKRKARTGHERTRGPFNSPMLQLGALQDKLIYSPQRGSNTCTTALKALQAEAWGIFFFQTLE